MGCQTGCEASKTRSQQASSLEVPGHPVDLQGSPFGCTLPFGKARLFLRQPVQAHSSALRPQRICLSLRRQAASVCRDLRGRVPMTQGSHSSCPAKPPVLAEAGLGNALPPEGSGAKGATTGTSARTEGPSAAPELHIPGQASGCPGCHVGIPSRAPS